VVRKSVKRCGQGSRAGRQFRYFQSDQHSALASLPRAMSTIALAPSPDGPELPEIVFLRFCCREPCASRRGVMRPLHRALAQEKECSRLENSLFLDEAVAQRTA